MNSTLKQINLRLRNINSLQIGLDIGGSLTKIAIASNSQNTNMNNNFTNNFDFIDKFNIDDKTFFIKMYKTAKFQTEALPFLKSKFII